MPHSSGGGSHGGGSHSSSSHGSSGSSGPRTSRRYFPGARTFVYYRSGRPYYVYADCDLHARRSAGPVRFLALIFLLPILFVLVMGLVGELEDPQPMRKTEAYDVAIEDKAGIFDSTSRLQTALADFKAATGITPVVLTVNNETWQAHYYNLENYAYEAYVTRFEDETHWLIVYSEPMEPDADFNDWYWEGMQGDETDDILSESKLSSFNTELHNNLLKSDKYAPEEAIALAFEDLTAHVMKRDVDLGEVVELSIYLVLVLVGIVVICLGDKLNRYKYDELCEVRGENKADPKTATCEYCGGIYTVGAHKQCPHCGATIEDYSSSYYGEE